MQLRDTGVLIAFMEAGDFSQARLGRYAGCSRQFIHMLVSGEKSTCTQQVGLLIEEAFRVPSGTLFVPKQSPVTQENLARRTTKAAG